MSGIVLVTGAAGFTGQYVCAALLAHGWRVAGLVREPEEAEGLDARVDVRCADLLDRDQLRRTVDAVRPSRVVHLAGQAFVADDDVEAMYRVNLIGTRHLLEALAESGSEPRAVVLASSANVYGHSPADPLHEGVAPAPANDYAVSKLAMEYMARCWLTHLPITIVRPFNYTGVGQSERFLLPKIVAHFARGEHTIELGNLDVERDFSDVRTVAEVYARLLSGDFAGETFDLCSGRAWSLREVLDTMATIAGYRISVRVNPAFVRADEVRRLRGSGAKLRMALARTTPGQVVPAHAFEETLRWMYAHAQKGWS